MKFEYDFAKSEANKRKHGLDFEEAQLLWHDENLLILPLRFTDEMRHACIGQIHGKMWTAIITYRKSVTRIISVRRAHKDEEKAYGC